MQERSFDEMIAFFNRRVADMDISQDCKMELLGMVTALGYKHEKTAQQWIPCSERLPEFDGEKYLVTDYCEQINRKRIHISYCYVNREGFWSDVPLGYKVIAWMPLPEPWRGEEHEQSRE